MNLMRFTQIIDAYGSRSEHWPEHERQAALELVSQSQEAETLLNEASNLDAWMDSGMEAGTPNNMNFSALNTRILLATTLSTRQKPNLSSEKTTAEVDSGSFVDRFIDWLLPASPMQLWRPLAGAALSLTIGIMVGFNSELVSQDPIEVWDDEIAMMAMDTAMDRTALELEGDIIDD